LLFGPLSFGDLAKQNLVGSSEVGRPFGHARSQLVLFGGDFHFVVRSVARFRDAEQLETFLIT
jgi:hypothetical protein